MLRQLEAHKKTGFALLLLFIIFLGVSPLISILLNKPVPVSAIRSFSMEPALTRGDLVVVWPTGYDYNYKLGQVVVFQSREHGIHVWTMHRIVGGDSVTGFITRGDANNYLDQTNLFPPIKPEWIAGVAPSIGNFVLKVPLVGYAVLFFSENMKNPFLFSVILLLLALLIVWKPRND